MKIYLKIILSALLLAVCRYSWNLDFLVFFAFLPFFSFFDEFSHTKKELIITSLTFTITYGIFCLYWISYVTIWGLLGIILVLSIYYFIIFWAINFVWYRLPKYKFLAFAFFFISLELFLNYGELCFPWLDIGYCLSNYTLLLQIADIGGVYFVSFFILLANIFIYKLIKKENKYFLYLAILFIFWISYGFYCLASIKIEQKNLKIALVQPSILLKDKHNENYLDTAFMIYDSFFQQAKSQKVDLAILSETGIPDWLTKRSSSKEKILNMAEKNSLDIFVGYQDYEKIDEKYLIYNSATLISKDKKISDPYYKRILVPLGERVPYLKFFPFLEKLSLGQANWEYGKNIVYYNIGNFVFSSTICYEIAFPKAFVEMVKNKQVDFLVNITNDDWYKTSRGPYQHRDMAKFRAIECRKPIYRTANTGFSVCILPNGKIDKQLNLYEKDLLIDYLKTSNKKSMFINYFSKSIYLYPIFAFVLLVMAFFKRKNYEKIL